MKAMLYMPKRDEPVAVLDEVKVVEFNDNHQSAPVRIYYTSKSLNRGKAMIEFHRDEKMLLRLEDGRSGDVLLQHSSLDMNGNAVGVLRVLGPLQG